jgi:ketosteroid isomerase-like protein
MTAPTTTKKSEILERVEEFWDATKSGDGARLGRVTADEFTFVMNRGISSSRRDDFVKMMTGGDFKLRSFDLDTKDVTFREFGPSAAFLACKVTLDYEMKGEPDHMDAYYSYVWTNDDGWKCAVATESRAGPTV